MQRACLVHYVNESLRITRKEGSNCVAFVFVWEDVPDYRGKFTGGERAFGEPFEC